MPQPVVRSIGTYLEDTHYSIPLEADTGPIHAINVLYNNAVSGLIATNVQSAIDELDSRLDSLGGVTWLYPHINSPAGNRITVDAGLYMKFDRSRLLNFVGSQTAPFPPISTLPRYDLVVIDDDGVLKILQGTESVTPAPVPFPCDAFVICQVYINEKSIVVINQSDLVDLRPLWRTTTFKKIDGGLIP